MNIALSEDSLVEHAQTLGDLLESVHLHRGEMDRQGAVLRMHGHACLAEAIAGQRWGTGLRAEDLSTPGRRLALRTQFQCALVMELDLPWLLADDIAKEFLSAMMPGETEPSSLARPTLFSAQEAVAGAELSRLSILMLSDPDRPDDLDRAIALDRFVLADEWNTSSLPHNQAQYRSAVMRHLRRRTPMPDDVADAVAQILLTMGEEKSAYSLLNEGMRQDWTIAGERLGDFPLVPVSLESLKARISPDPKMRDMMAARFPILPTLATIPGPGAAAIIEYDGMHAQVVDVEGSELDRWGLDDLPPAIGWMMLACTPRSAIEEGIHLWSGAVETFTPAPAVQALRVRGGITGRISGCGADHAALLRDIPEYESLARRFSRAFDRGLEVTELEEASSL